MNDSAGDKDLFGYDSSKLISPQELNMKQTDSGIKIRELTFDTNDSSINPDGNINCYLVLPKGNGPFPAVLYMHWYGPVKGNKDEFLEEATALAEKGAAGLLIDGFFPWKILPSELNKDKSLIVYQVIELRRALDHIVSLPYIDPKRIGYVGHDYGAMFGAVLSGIDKRVSSFVLAAGMGSFSDWFIQYWVPLDEDGMSKYRQGMSGLDPEKHIRNAAPAKIFLQFANNDRFVTKDEADKFYNASSRPKEVRFYDTIHEMDDEQVRLDRQNWLMSNLF